MNKKKNPICLSIAGIDPSGGAGTLADIKTFTAFGCIGTAAIASITFQNTTKVFGVLNQTAEAIRNQVQPILDDFEVDALKTGMLPTKEVIEEVAELVEKNKLKNFVVDPVVRSTSGYDLIDDAALKSLIEKLFPLSIVVTPNIPEAERISGVEIKNEEDLKKAGKIIQALGAKNVLLKGGHFPKKEVESRKLKVESQRLAKDYLFTENDLVILEGEYYETDSTHGTGCTLSAAIAANLALGKTLFEAVEISKKFVNEAIRTSPNIGKGFSPINHLLFDFVKENS